MSVFRAILVAAGLSLAAASAQATTVDFTIKDGATVDATGSFSYSSANTNLSYSDLSAFSITFAAGPPTFDLPFVLSHTTCQWFDYDTVGQQFVVGSLPPANCYGLPELMGAGDSGLGTGFIFVDQNPPYWTDNNLSLYHQPYDTVIVSVEAVPEPGALALIASALLGLGWVGWRRGAPKADAQHLC
jgi:hypothetical protein